jgi:hypothetical protein
MLLLAMTLGQVAIWSQPFRYSVSVWDPKRMTCIAVSTAPQPIIVSVFAYSKCCDALTLHVRRLT